jgi:hypothetical protein
MAIDQREAGWDAVHSKEIGLPPLLAPIEVKIRFVGIAAVRPDFALRTLSDIGLEIIGVELNEIVEDWPLPSGSTLDAQLLRFRACRHRPIML